MMKARKTPGSLALPDIAVLPAALRGEDSAAQEALRQLLLTQKLPQLRAVAAARGVNTRGTQRETLVAALIESLGDSATQTRLLGDLTQPARAILALAVVLDWTSHPVTAGLVRRLLREGTSGAAIEAALNRLTELGLLLSPDGLSRPDPSYVLPQVIRDGLIPLLPEVRAYSGDLPATDSAAAGLAETLPLALGKLAALLRALAGAEYLTAAPAPRPYRGRETWNMGRWEVVGEPPVPLRRGRDEPPVGIEVADGRGVLAPDDLARLHAAAGLGSEEETQFYLALAEAMGLVRHPGRSLVVPAGGLDGDETMTDLILRLVTAYMNLNTWSELDPLLHSDPALALFRNHILHYAEPLHMRTDVAHIRQALQAVLAWLPVGAWHDTHTVLTSLHRLFPELPTPSAGVAFGWEQLTWWLARSDGHGGWIYLDRNSTPDWMRGLGKLVATVISGPLVWLGLAEATAIDGTLLGGARRDAPAGFRLTALGGALLGNRPPEIATLPLVPVGAKPPAKEAPAARVRPDGADLLLLLDPRALPLDQLIAIGRFAEPVRVDPELSTYRLTARAVRRAFEDGLTAADIAGTLRGLTGEALSAACDARLQGWWDAYGRLRFYSGVTLIRFSDDFTLTELLTTTDLGNLILYQFSPRLVAVPETVVDRLLADLTRAGHTPRVVDDALPVPTGGATP